jgi:hypothetical protein
MSNTFTFDGYTVRPARETDRAYLSALIEADPYHRGRMDADFFLKTTPGEDSWALEDEQGKVVFYFKTITAVRLAIQFPQVNGMADRARHGAALLRGMLWIEGILRGNHFHELLFDTEGPQLRSFARQRLGFTETPMLLSKPLDTPKPPRKSPGAVGSVPTSGQEREGDANVRPY